MIAKMRMQVGDAVISWGALPQASSIDGRNALPARPKFAVIDGDRTVASSTRDEPLSLQAKSA
jgi:hypothetical protein